MWCLFTWKLAPPGLDYSAPTKHQNLTKKIGCEFLFSYLNLSLRKRRLRIFCFVKKSVFHLKQLLKICNLKLYARLDLDIQKNDTDLTPGWCHIISHLLKPRRARLRKICKIPQKKYSNVVLMSDVYSEWMIFSRDGVYPITAALPINNAQNKTHHQQTSTAFK